MKKNCVNIGILILVGLLLVTGCEPDNWDVNSKGWTYHAEGTIVNKIGKKNTSNSNRRMIVITLQDGAEINIGNMKNTANMKVGQNGILYKYVDWEAHNDERGWFQWVVKTEGTIAAAKSLVGVAPIISREIGSPKIIERVIPHKIVQIIEVPKLYEWQYYSKFDGPAPYKVVLIKWNDIITTGHRNERWEWKLEVNNGKTLGGPTVDIKEWRELEQ